MEKGYFLPVLHAHLPYVRHPEHEFFLEENWFFEAVVDCYIPLTRVLMRLREEKVRFGITISLSPTLLEMLSDRLLRQRLRRHMERLVVLTEAEVARTYGEPGLNSVALMYRDKWADTLDVFENEYDGDLIGALRSLSTYPGIEFITTAATHAFLPNLMPVPEAVRAQIEGGMLVFEKHMGHRPRGFWLPECGYCQGLDRFVREAGGEYFFLEAHGVLHASPRPMHGIYRPILCGSGTAAFGRDPFAAERVWCAQRGYPADPVYRDFYSDLGFDNDHRHVREHLIPMLPEGEPSFTGLKYRRITGAGVSKEIYDPLVARSRAADHAGDFVRALGSHVSLIHEKYGFTPVITAPYDAELFGHWWFEGPIWLEEVLRATSAREAAGEGPEVISMTASEYLRVHRGELETAEPSMSSWGSGGYSSIWTEPEGGRIAARLLASARRMGLRARESMTGGPSKRALDQAMRELMLAQSSDWMFMINKGAHTGYASERLEEHLRAFDELMQAAGNGGPDGKRLHELETNSHFMKDIGAELYL